MAKEVKESSKKSLSIVGVKPETIALFEGVFAAIVGLFVAVVYALRTTIHLSQSTNSVLAGLSFGIVAGIVSIIIVPLVYFAIGWIIGWVHGVVFNFIVKQTDGIVLYTKEK